MFFGVELDGREVLLLSRKKPGGIAVARKIVPCSSAKPGGESVQRA
jgi:hypothetical protein